MVFGKLCQFEIESDLTERHRENRKKMTGPVAASSLTKIVALSWKVNFNFSKSESAFL
jgi:hypothetical protein